LLIGTIGYCIYVFGFLTAVEFNASSESAAAVVYYISAGIGGIAGGFLWTAQGRYFTRNSKLYSECTGQSIENVNSDYAGIFSAYFLGIEVFTKIIATVCFLLFPTLAPYIIFSLYSAFATVSCFVVASLDNLNDDGTWNMSYKAMSSEAGAAAKLIYLDARMSLIVPFQIAFGFASSFVPYYVFGTVISDSPHLGEKYVGILSALVVFIGAIMSLPFAWMGKLIGKRTIITIGGFCLVFTGLAFFIASNDVIGTWYFIVPYLCIYGIGRGTWENTNKAILADFYGNSPDQGTAAFAAAIFFNGYAAAMGYFSFSSISRYGMAGAVTFTSIFAIICYYFAFRLDDSIRQQHKEDQKKASIRKQEFDNYKIRRLKSTSTEAEVW
jgi:hypothetical protein